MLAGLLPLVVGAFLAFDLLRVRSGLVGLLNRGLTLIATPLQPRGSRYPSEAARQRFFDRVYQGFGVLFLVAGAALVLVGAVQALS